MNIIFISLECWDEVWRRNQFVCAELARRAPDAKILFVGLSIDVSNAVRRRQLGRIFRASTYPVEGLANVTVTHPLKLLPDSIGWARRINAAMFRRHVRKVATGLGMKRPLLWLNPHSAVHMVGQMNESGCVYDVTDDWTALSQSEALRLRIVEQDAELCGRASAVIVCSKRLYELKQGMARRLFLIENGVHAEHYAEVLEDGPVPVGSGAWAKPVFGYTGTVHPDRVDVAMVEAVAKKLERGSMVFVGPNHLSAADQARLVATGKIHFAGPVPYADLPQYMRAIDVCIVPHRMTAFTESLNPIKLWEYLAAGKPIVSTDVAGFRDYSQLVRIATTADEFVEAMWLAEAEGFAKASSRREVACEHSWARRVDAIIEVINQCIGGQVTEPGELPNREACVV
jgi:teichuronic acid biosynthesis glycosyltransferase TuaH